jgi:hypothetical protein
VLHDPFLQLRDLAVDRVHRAVEGGALVAAGLVCAELRQTCLGPGAVVVYLLFAFLAYMRYPASFSPQNNNWLSDLGNRDLNPQGPPPVGFRKYVRQQLAFRNSRSIAP